MLYLEGVCTAALGASIKVLRLGSLLLGNSYCTQQGESGGLKLKEKRVEGQCVFVLSENSSSYLLLPPC